MDASPLHWLLTLPLTFWLPYLPVLLWLLWLFSYFLTYLLTPRSTVLLEKLTVPQPVKKYPSFYGTWRFITVFTSARHLSQSWASSIQSILPHLTSWRSILILSYYLRLGLPSGLFPPGSPTKTLHTPLLSPIRATCPAHLINIDLITRIYVWTFRNMIRLDCE